MEWPLLAWYAVLVGAAVLNPFLLVRTHRRYPYSDNPQRRKYQRMMLLLAIPMVVECAWRGVFPSLYLQVRSIRPAHATQARCVPVEPLSRPRLPCHTP